METIRLVLFHYLFIAYTCEPDYFFKSWRYIVLAFLLYFDPS